MTIFAFQSAIDYSVGYITVHGTRWYKRRFVYRSECKIKRDMLTYMDMYAGPEYPFYYQVAKTIIIVMVCVIFGSSMPMLYLLAIIALVLQYIVDRWSLAYFHRQPPMYTDKLTKAMLNMLSVAPILSLSILFWQYTNK